MQKVKKIIISVLSVILVGIVGFSFISTYKQNHSGGWSSVCTLTDADKEWIKDNYNDCQSIEELLYAINDDICNEYTYVDKQYFLGMQHFNFSDFIRTKQGLCFDFSCYTKSVCLYMSELKGWNVRALVCDVKLKSVGYHSYNFIVFIDEKGEEFKYYTDMTDNLTRYENNEEYYVYYYLAEQSFEEFASGMFEDTIRNFH